MIQFLGVGLLSWLARLAGGFLSDGLLKFAAYKLLLYSLIVTTVPIVVKNLIVWFFDEIVKSSSTVANLDGMQATVLDLTGAAGYLANQLMIPDCISIIMAALVLRFTLNFIPFVG